MQISMVSIALRFAFPLVASAVSAEHARNMLFDLYVCSPWYTSGHLAHYSKLPINTFLIVLYICVLRWNGVGVDVVRLILQNCIMWTESKNFTM